MRASSQFSMPPWAAAHLGLPADAAESARRRAMLRLIRDANFLPSASDTLAIQRAAQSPVPALAWLPPAAVEIETFKNEIEELRKVADRVPAREGRRKIDALRKLAGRYSFVRRSLDQIAGSLGLGGTGDPLRTRLAGWLRKPPTLFAAERLRWFDANPEENRAFLRGARRRDRISFGGLPDLFRYLRSKHPRINDARPLVRRPKAKRAPKPRKRMHPAHRNAILALSAYAIFLISMFVADIVTESRKKASRAPAAKAESVIPESSKLPMHLLLYESEENLRRRINPLPNPTADLPNDGLP